MGLLFVGTGGAAETGNRLLTPAGGNWFRGTGGLLFIGIIDGAPPPPPPPGTGTKFCFIGIIGAPPPPYIL